MNFKIYKIDVKSIFLNRYITKKVYVEQSLDCESHAILNHIFKLNKILYGLK